MKKVVSPLGILLIIVVVFGVTVWSLYNRLVGLDERVEASWSQVENVYQRRADLVPNLVRTVEGARDFEQETLQDVVEARTKVGQLQVNGVPSAEQLEAFQSSQGELGGALSRLMVTVERYPDLKATEAFLDLQRQLEGAENRIAVERRRFNEVTRAYDTALRRFPANYIAAYFGFESAPYFEADVGAENPPEVNFSN